MPSPRFEPGIHTDGVPWVSGETCIGKRMLFKGTVFGSGSLFVDGVVEGNIDLPESRVTVGVNGRVSESMTICINAHEIVIIGMVRGDVSAVSSVEIRGEGSLIGNVRAARISIADGAYFKGNIELHGVELKAATPVPSGLNKEDL
jgi:cytoskeletal protein CcmA (bactofilin family)